MMILKLAWRNIWRNKRRTWITVAAIGFAVFFSATMKSSQLGSYANMIDNVTRFFTGYVQIHEQGYWDDKTLEKTFVASDDILNIAQETKYTEDVAPRLESFALAAFGNQSKGSLVLGIDPKRESSLTKLKEKLIEGEYLSADDKAVMISEGLAHYLKMDLNDTIVLISQGYRGVNSAGKYPVKGIVKFPSPDLNGQLIYLPLKEAQWFYGAEDRLTSIAITIKHPDLAEDVVTSLDQQLGEGTYEIMGWREMLPELLQQIELDYVGGLIMRFILYTVIAFGIFGTFLMMVNERKYEFGVMMAIGMKRYKLQLIVFAETIMIAFTGALVGILAASPLIFYFNQNPIRFTGEYAKMFEDFGVEPILPFSIEPQVFYGEAQIVFVITVILALYPLWAIHKLHINNAIRA